jgi:hypothetical protein
MKLRKSNLIDHQSGQPIYLPEFEKGEEGYEEQQEIRRRARESARSLKRMLEGKQNFV